MKRPFSLVLRVLAPASLALAGCTPEEEVPTAWTLSFDAGTEIVDFGLITYEDTPPTVPLTLANQSGVPLLFGGLAVEGHGEELVAVSGAPAAGAGIAQDGVLALELTITEEVAWLTGWYEPDLVLTASGEAEGDETPPAREWRLPLLVKLLCDLDGDGYDAAGIGGTDCDDEDPTIHPLAGDPCNDRDDDCDDAVDEDPDLEWYPDADGDGWGAAGDPVAACTAPSGYADNMDDCDEADPNIHPEADEYCNRIDDDCDGETDENPAVDGSTWYEDRDADGWGSSTELTACVAPVGFVGVTGDCDDSLAVVHPGHPEYCDGSDQDCDGEVDEDPIDGRFYFADADGDGFGDEDVAVAGCTAPSGYVSLGGDCDDGTTSINPDAADLCGALADGVDDDCDGVADNPDDGVPYYLDDDGDGYGDASSSELSCVGPPIGYVADSTDCDDLAADVHPGAEDLCAAEADGVDDDCDGVADNPYDAVTYYADEDGDGYGDASSTELSCVGPSVGFVADSTDCDDGAAAVNPAGVEICGGGVDEDCDGDVDCADGECDGVLPCSFDLAGADAVFVGETAGDLAGTSLAGDFDGDGDGFDDLLIGAPGQDSGGTSAGAAYLVLGPVSGTLDLSAADGKLLGVAADDQAGTALSWAGDADGDGLGDLLFGAPGSDTGGSASGGAYLVLGAPTGTADLSIADLTLVGAAAGDEAGAAVAGVGDTDGDGLADLLIGAPGYDGAASNAGGAHLVLGGTLGTLDLGSADGVLLGEAASDAAGEYVSAGGDLDGDGYADLLVGAPSATGGATGSGVFYVVRGPVWGEVSLADAWTRVEGIATGDDLCSAAAGDFDGDGDGDLVLGADADARGGATAGAAYLVLGPLGGVVDLSLADGTLLGDAASARAGGSVAALPDIDGDGDDEAMVGAWGATWDGTRSGAAYLVTGAWTGDLPEAGASFGTTGASDRVGESLGSAGDSDGDGIPDLVIAAPYQDTGGSAAGAVFLVLGSHF